MSNERFVNRCAIGKRAWTSRLPREEEGLQAPCSVSTIPDIFCFVYTCKRASCWFCVLCVDLRRDFQKKRDVIKDLKRKVLERNPDEFYFNMTRTHMKDGSHQLRNPFKDYTEDEIKLMKSQDKNYIKMHHQIELKVDTRRDKHQCCLSKTNTTQNKC